MATRATRREFLADVGSSVLLASVGPALATELGFSTAQAAEGPERLLFGDLEPLVGLMQETPADRIIAASTEALAKGVELKKLVAAAALANARTFGGEDYIGFHTMMALSPSYHMSKEMPAGRAALPVFKVLYRNTNRIHEFGGKAAEVLRKLEAEACCEDCGSGESIRDAVRAKDLKTAEESFAVAAAKSAQDALNAVLYVVDDATEVHRVALPYRAWDLLGVVGAEHAKTLLRQSVRYCFKSETRYRNARYEPRTILPELLDRYKLLAKTLGTRKADDSFVEQLSKTFFEAKPELAAEAAAMALAEGFEPDAIGEAISLAANQLVLRDAGRTPREISEGKPVGSVHGDSIGVHASDSANAWRNLSKAGNARNKAACLILGAFQVALDRVDRGGDFLHWQPRPHAEELAAVTATDTEGLVKQLHEAVRNKDQSKAVAVAHKAVISNVPARPIFDALLGYAVSEDGALHAEKYYRTVSEEYAATRPAFRGRHLVALARVTASEFGRPAPGYSEACHRLNVV